jgi:hypothetical protein
MYEISKNTYLSYVIYLFSNRNLFNDVFNRLERVAFDGSVISDNKLKVIKRKRYFHNLKFFLGNFHGLTENEREKSQ